MGLAVDIVFVKQMLLLENLDKNLRWHLKGQPWAVQIILYAVETLKKRKQLSHLRELYVLCFQIHLFHTNLYKYLTVYDYDDGRDD